MTTVTPLPTPAPSRQDPINFSTRADAFLGALPTFGTELNLVAGEVNTNASNAATSASTATTQAGIATTQAGIATTKANEATTARNEAVALTESYQGSLSTDPVLDKNGNPLSAGDWYINSSTGLIRVYTGIVWTTSVSATAGVNSINAQQGDLSLKTINANSLLGTGNIDTSSNLMRSARTSNVRIIASDKGTMIDITSGTFTQTFAACSALGNGWWCYIRNSGTGDITLDPNASETIDGLTSYIMYPGEVRLVQCDGTALRTVVLNSFYKTFISSGTFIKPPGYSAFQGLLWGGGGSGSRNYTNSPNASSGGGGGACTPFVIPSGNLLASEPFVIGAGGTGQPTNNQPGFAGGTSTFKNITAFGGGGGAVSISNGGTQGGGGGGSLSAGSTGGASLAVYGSPIGNGGFYGGGHGVAGTDEYGQKSVFGGGGGGGTDSAVGTAGGISMFGGAGGVGGISAPGNGVAPGGGGGGAISATSGAGARGELRIWGLV